MIGPNGERFIVTKPLTKTAAIQQLRDNKNEYSSYIHDVIRGSYSNDPNSYTKKVKVENPASAKRIILGFILD